MGGQGVDDGPRGEGADHARGADLAGQAVHPHLDEVGAEGIGRPVLARAAADHRHLALIEARDGVWRRAFGRVLGVDFQGSAGDAADRLGQRLMLARPGQGSALQLQLARIDPAEGTGPVRHGGCGQARAHLFAGLEHHVDRAGRVV